MFPGVGTVVNVVAVLAGATTGRLLGDRLPVRTRDVVTDGLGLVTLLIAVTSALAVADPALAAAIGDAAPMLVVLGSVVLGGILGSALRLTARLEALGDLLRVRLGGADTADGTADASRQRFVEGFVVASLVFCTGPLTVVGALEDGLGRGADQLFLKSVLDGFAAIAFAATFGWGVAASVVTLVAVQGSLTVVGVLAGDVLPAAETAALGATGGVLLIGVALRLLRVRELPVADLLPALALAPLLTVLARLATG